jgi:hypothetical protein
MLQNGKNQIYLNSTALLIYLRSFIDTLYFSNYVLGKINKYIIKKMSKTRKNEQKIFRFYFF